MVVFKKEILSLRLQNYINLFLCDTLNLIEIKFDSNIGLNTKK